MSRSGSGLRHVGESGRPAIAIVTALLLAVGALSAAVRPAAAAEGPNSLDLRATYDVTATLKWAKGRLFVTSTAHVTNTSADPVNALSFNLVPARIGSLVLGPTLVDGAPASASVDDQTIVVELPEPLPRDGETSVTIKYASTFRANGTDKNWLFAKLEGYATAYRWIPWLSRPTQFNRSNIGDPFVTMVSPHVQVSITTDRALGIAATGRRTGVNGLTQTFEAANVRDFNFAASPSYALRTEMFRGIRINYWYHRINIDKIQKWTRNAVARFETRVGEYPYDTLTIAENHGTSAMESPQMIWMPWNTPGSNIAYLTVHELGHQWFYGVIGNSQPWQPFADEGINDFITRDYLGHRASRCATNTLDKSIYQYQGRCYYETIYVQGALYINNYRNNVGNDNFWAALRDFYQAKKFGSVTTREFWDFMDAKTGFTGSHAGRFPSLYP